jgi:hypothetical protein
VALAVAAGREKSRPGTVVPLISDRRTPPAAPAVDVARADFLSRPFRQ